MVQINIIDLLCLACEIIMVAFIVYDHHKR